MENSIIAVISGLDPSGGAGISTDIRAISAAGCVSAPVITAIACQSHSQGGNICLIDESAFSEALGFVLETKPRAIKIGMTGSVRTIEIIAERLEPISKRVSIVLDPVFRSTSGMELANPEAFEALVKKLLPISSLLTPNLEEAGQIAGLKLADVEDIYFAGAQIATMTGAVLIKGGHSEGSPIDYLFSQGQSWEFASKRIEGEFRGTGCALASLIACGLALGKPLPEAVCSAKERLTIALRNSTPPYIIF